MTVTNEAPTLINTPPGVKWPNHCGIRGMVISPCDTLADASQNHSQVGGYGIFQLAGHGARGAGFYRLYEAVFETGTAFLNCCPFCGTSFQSAITGYQRWTRADATKAADKQLLDELEGLIVNSDAARFSDVFRRLRRRVA